MAISGLALPAALPDWRPVVVVLKSDCKVVATSVALALHNRNTVKFRPTEPPWE